MNPNRTLSRIDLEDDDDLGVIVRGGAADILNVMGPVGADGQDGPAFSTEDEGQDKKIEEDPEEEQRHIEERLRSFRLELLDELKSQGSSRSAGDFASGDVSSLRLSRPASAIHSENSDRLESPRGGAPRHLKPIMTLEIPASRFPLAFSRSESELSSQEAQQQYYDKVFELFSMDPEAMKLREQMSGCDFA